MADQSPQFMTPNADSNKSVGGSGTPFTSEGPTFPREGSPKPNTKSTGGSVSDNKSGPQFMR